ncbi:hypothetical protein LCGC14_1058140 [marine sediment metagenome]|uniref:Uncharacterized protein n=1 Tax=marine sediment metagenome TaxID=412755 RepID=A0A0F9N8V6_9ZZZZ
MVCFTAVYHRRRSKTNFHAKLPTVTAMSNKAIQKISSIMVDLLIPGTFSRLDFLLDFLLRRQPAGV